MNQGIYFGRKWSFYVDSLFVVAVALGVCL